MISRVPLQEGPFWQLAFPSAIPRVTAARGPGPGCSDASETWPRFLERARELARDVRVWPRDPTIRRPGPRATTGG